MLPRTRQPHCPIPGGVIDIVSWVNVTSWSTNKIYTELNMNGVPGKI